MFKYANILIFLFYCVNLSAQSDSNSDIILKEREIQNFFSELLFSKTDTEKNAASNKIYKALKSVLISPESFRYSFDSLPYLGKVTSEDSLVRVFTWNIQYLDGTYTYYGFVQHYFPRVNTVELHTLTDKSSEQTFSDATTFTAENWSGALYYDIILTKSRKQTYYTLLGWDGNNLLTSKKIIDAVTFNKGGKPVFGAPVFNTPEGLKYRIMFEFANRASMMVRYFKDKEMIVCDHLSPADPKYKGIYQYYGPDFSYDTYILENGIWNYEADIDFKNPNKQRSKDEDPERGLERE